MGDTEAEEGDNWDERGKILERSEEAGRDEEKDEWWSPSGHFHDLSRDYHDEPNLHNVYLQRFWAVQEDRMRALELPRLPPFPVKRVRRIIRCDEDVSVRPHLIIIFLSFFDFSFHSNLHDFRHSTLNVLLLPLSFFSYLPSHLEFLLNIQREKQRIASEVVELISMAAELFCADVALRAWLCSKSGKIILKNIEISMAIRGTPSYDFLVDILPPQKVRLGSDTLTPHDQLLTLSF